MANDLSQALSDVEKLTKSVSPGVVEHVGEFVVFIVTNRTLAGIDANGNAFKPYVKKYADWRKKKQLRANPPNLKVKGHMLGAIEYRKTGDNEVTFGFESPHEADKAGWNTGMGREWFDLRKEDELKLLEEEIANAFMLDFSKG